MTRDLNQELSKNPTLARNEKLSGILAKINEYKKSGKEVMQEEVDLLEKEYQIALAQIALEEAENSKTSMRLMRDAAGNWDYVYTADLEAIDKAKQDLEDAEYEMRQYQEEILRKSEDKIIAIYAQTIQRINELDINQFESEEAYLAEVNRIWQEAYLQMDAYGGLIGSVLEITSGTATESGLAFKDLVLAQIT
jgi:hypothetical protein